MCTWEGRAPGNETGWALKAWERICVKSLGILMESKLYMSWKGALAVEKASSILGFVNRGMMYENM